MNTEQATSAINSVTHAFEHYSHLFLESDLGMFITSLPAGVFFAIMAWIMLSIAFPKFRNPDTNPIILSIVKIIAIVFVVAWMIRVELNYRKQVRNAL